MKIYDPKQDVNRLLLRDELEPKRRKLLQRLTNHVLEGKHETRVDRVEEVSLMIEIAISKDRRYIEKANEILRAISCGLLQNHGTDVFLDIFNRNLLNADRIKKNLHDASSRFCAKFAQFVGEELSRSLQFALDLIQIGHEDIEQKAIANREQRMFKMSQYRMAVSSYILSGFLTPPCEAIRSKQWIERLIEAVGSNRQVSDVLTSIILMVEWKCELRLVRATGLLPVEEASREYIDRMKEYKNMTNSDSFLTCCFQEKHIRLLDKWIDACNRDGMTKQNKGDDLIRWFNTHHEEIAVAIEERRKMIFERPHHGLRPFGYDRVKIQTSALLNTGILEVVFHPENHEFPNTGIEVRSVQIKPHITSFLGEFEHLDSIYIDPNIYSELQHPKEKLSEIFRCVLIDIMYRIIAQTNNRRAKFSNELPKTVGQAPELRVAVRPYIRRLPMGFEATDRAKSMAQEFFRMKLPDGVTFVQSHVRCGDWSMTNPSVEPLFTYSDDDCRDLLRSISEKQQTHDF